MNFLIPQIFLILMFCQISIGAFVSGMDAGTIYNTWPLMGTSYFPNDNELRIKTVKKIILLMHLNM